MEHDLTYLSLKSLLHLDSQVTRSTKFISGGLINVGCRIAVPSPLSTCCRASRLASPTGDFGGAATPTQRVLCGHISISLSLVAFSSCRRSQTSVAGPVILTSTVSTPQSYFKPLLTQRQAWLWYPPIPGPTTDYHHQLPHHLPPSTAVTVDWPRSSPVQVWDILART